MYFFINITYKNEKINRQPKALNLSLYIYIIKKRKKKKQRKTQKNEKVKKGKRLPM